MDKKWPTLGKVKDKVCLALIKIFDATPLSAYMPDGISIDNIFFTDLNDWG